MKLVNGFLYAFRGLWLALREQLNMKIHLCATALIMAAGFYLNFNYIDWCIVAITVGVVIGMELINTSIEEFVNFVSPEQNTEAAKIKDIAASAVLVVSIAALLVGILLVSSKLF